MPRFRAMALKSLAVAALAVAVAGPTQLVVAAAAGRDYSRCIQSCNDVRRACSDRCQVDCRDMFPNDATQRNACITACKTACDTESADCKLVCQAIKNGGCPTEP